MKAFFCTQCGVRVSKPGVCAACYQGVGEIVSLYKPSKGKGDSKQTSNSSDDSKKSTEGKGDSKPGK